MFERGAGGLNKFKRVEKIERVERVNDQDTITT
jgi:hypothetical protein